MQKRLFTLVVMLTAIFASALAQVTTSGISGKVLSAGDDVIGATVTATHNPSGTVYRAVTNIDGRFSIQGMRVGGPYTVEVSYIGMETKKFENVSLTLGETEDLSCSLSNDSKELEEVVVTGQAGVDATKTGAAQSINARRISEIPTVSHSIADIARMNPQITTNGQSGAMSFAGRHEQPLQRLPDRRRDEQRHVWSDRQRQQRRPGGRPASLHGDGGADPDQRRPV